MIIGRLSNKPVGQDFYTWQAFYFSVVWLLFSRGFGDYGGLGGLGGFGGDGTGDGGKTSPFLRIPTPGGTTDVTCPANKELHFTDTIKFANGTTETFNVTCGPAGDTAMATPESLFWDGVRDAAAAFGVAGAGKWIVENGWKFFFAE